MKLTEVELIELLEKQPVRVDEYDIKEVFGILGLKLKEYFKTSALGPSHAHFEVHYCTEYLFQVEVDNTRSVSINNEYRNLCGDGTGLCFGSTDTLKDLLKLVILLSGNLKTSYRGQVHFDPERSEYTEEEFKSLVDILNQHIFQEEQA
jgi:hypothetical protein